MEFLEKINLRPQSTVRLPVGLPHALPPLSISPRLPGSVTLGKTFPLSEPQFIRLKMLLFHQLISYVFFNLYISG